MSNLRSSGHMPLKTPMTNKWKSQAPTSDLLERQTRALEDSLNKLKLAMHPDKNKTNTEVNGPIWDRGKTGPLSQYASHILRDDSRRVFDANKPTKIRVLGDEPPATVTRPSLVANIFSNKPTPSAAAVANKLIKCGQCEKEEAKMKCLECAESYCASCFAHFHLRGALQRHRCVPLGESRPATPQKKKTPVGADVIFKELRFAQSKDDLLRKSTMASSSFTYPDDDLESEEGEGGELLRGNYDEKTSAASFQQALLQWRQGGNKKKLTKVNRSTHEAAVDTLHDSNGILNPVIIPNIEFHSSNLTYGEKLLVKKYRRANKNNQEFFIQRTPESNNISKESANKITEILVDRSLPETIRSKTFNVDVEPLYDDLPTVRTEDSARTITAENIQNNNHFDRDDDEEEVEEELIRLKQQERTKSRTSMKGASRPTSAAMRKNSISSRPSSVAMFQHPLPSLLATNASEDLKAIADPQTRPSSAALKKPTKFDYRLPTIWNRNWKPEQSVIDGLDPKSIQIDQHSINQFDSALQDLLDEDKIESASRSDKPMDTSRPPTADIRRIERERPIETPTPTTQRNSPFNFINSSRKVESSSSADTGDGGFFTDIVRKKIPTSPVPPPQPAPPVIEPAPSSRSIRSSIEQRSAIPNLVSLRKASIESFSRPPPKRSINLEEAHTQIDDQSRPGSSLSSASLPVSIISSKPDFITRPSIERHPKILPQTTTTTTTKKFRVEFSKKASSSPPPPPLPAPSMVIEGKKVTSARNSARESGDDRLQQSIHFTRNKVPSGIQKSHSTIKASSNSTMTSITRDENIFNNESLTITDATIPKGNPRRSSNIEREPTKSRRMEFTIKDGMKWQTRSSESGPMKSVVRHSSKVITPRPSTPSNPTNSKLAQQFSTYDNDDGRSSRACQDVEDEEYFNHLNEELCSELRVTSPGWDASLSEHVLKNLRGPEIPFNEKDLQDNLNMLEMKLRENESIPRSQTDDDLSVHDEIRNL